ncbi:hypothetical protein [Pedobacter aquatilis]|uniref:hypothetical protein n=1 Tax=Pedobacter aquatilis TaxID=351343 RepID=UPI0029308E9E|nr:hypothetical protein [Pedobacter aquatilis]
MKNQTSLKSLQKLIHRAEMLTSFQPENFEDIFNTLRSFPQLQTPNTALLLNDVPTEKNWLNIKYNIIDDMVTKVGDFLKS